MRIFISASSLIKYFIIAPCALLGFHLGIIAVHIMQQFSFEIPMFLRITGILSSLWVLLSIYIWIDYHKKMKQNDTN